MTTKKQSRQVPRVDVSHENAFPRRRHPRSIASSDVAITLSHDVVKDILQEWIRKQQSKAYSFHKLTLDDWGIDEATGRALFLFVNAELNE